MSDLNSVDYYRGRERQERVLAAAAVDPAIAAIHHEMAFRYSELVGQADMEARSRPALRLVG